MNVTDSESDGDDGVIGPSLPPHLQKKGGQLAVGEIGPALPSTKKQEDIGPALPPHLLVTARGGSTEPGERSFDVQLPPDYSRWNTFDADLNESDDKDAAGRKIGIGSRPNPTDGNDIDNDDGDDDDDDDTYGPALPPGFKKPTHSTDELEGDKRTTSSHGASYGPAFLPGFQHGSHTPITKDEEDDDDDDDELIGPMPMKPGTEGTYGQSAAEEFEKRSIAMKKKLSSQDEQSQPKRESWMMELPGYSNNFGLGARTFRKNPLPEPGDRSGWTDTPADRARKEQERAEKRRSEERRGKSKKSAEAVQELSERDQRLSAMVDKHNETARGQSLVEIHTKKRRREMEEEKDKPKERRPFDRELDLNVNQFDEAKRKQLIKKSAQLNERFSHSKGKVFL